MTVLPWQSWPELVFHVLAHLRATADLPASAFDAGYCAFVARHAGPAAERELAEDVRLLDRLLGEHVQLAAVQTLAWLFEEVDSASAVADVDLALLCREQVARPWALAALPLSDPALELLRCAALLERDTLACLPAVEFALEPWQETLAGLQPLAPQLAQLAWRPLRALGMRGRVAVGEVWTGVPSDDREISAECLGWQVAHEACVWEVAHRLPGLGEREVEQLAVLLLAERARLAGRGAEHGQWLARLHRSVSAWINAGPSASQRQQLDVIVGT